MEMYPKFVQTMSKVGELTLEDVYMVNSEGERRVMPFPKNLPLLVFFFLLSGCFHQTVPVKPNAMQKPVAVVNKDIRYEEFSSEAVDTVNRWQPNSYYARLHVEPFGMVSGISKCREASSFAKGMKAYFGIENATGFYVSMNIISKNKVIADNVVVMSYLVDDLNNNASKCKTKYLKGYLTPYFKVNSSLDIKISYSIHYIDNNNIDIVTKLEERSTSVINYFATKSVGALVNEVFSPVINPIGTAIEKSLNIVATDTLASQFSLNSAVGQKRIDGSKLDVSPIFPGNKELSTGIGAKLKLVYYKSVVGLGEDKVIYEDDPSQMLSSIFDSKNQNLDVYTILQQNKINGIVVNSLKAYKEKDHKEYLSNACRVIKNYAAKELGLTKDDSLALRWAILTEFSNYNESLDIRTDACFRKNELEDLIKLNINYIFKKDRDIIKKERSSYVHNLISDFASSAVSDHIKGRYMYNMDKLSLYINLSNSLPKDINAYLTEGDNGDNENMVFYGEDAIQKSQKILSRVRCVRISSVSPHDDLAFVGKLNTIHSEPKYVLGGLSVERYGDENKIKTIYLADKELIDQFIKPYEGWPIGQSEGHCPKDSDKHLIIGI